MRHRQSVKLGSIISAAPNIRCGSDSYPVLSMTMRNGLMLQSDRFKKSIASADQSNYKVVKHNQLVVGFPIDEGVLSVQDLVPAGIVSPAYAVWDVDVSQIRPTYLERYLRSPQSISYYKSKLRGTTARRRSLTTADLLALPVSLPTIEEQEKICATLDAVSELLRLRKTQLAELGNLVKSHFIELFDNKGYRSVELISLIQDGAGLSYGIVQPGEDGTGDMGVLRPVDLTDGQIILDGIKYIDRSIGEGFKRTELNGDELLITVRGTTGITALTDIKFRRMNVTRGIAVVRYDRNKVNPVYLNECLKSEISQRYIAEHTQGATLRQINLSDLRVQPILYPPIEQQNNYSNFVKQAGQTKSEIQQALDETQRLFDSLMAEYFEE